MSITDGHSASSSQGASRRCHWGINWNIRTVEPRPGSIDGVYVREGETRGGGRYANYFVEIEAIDGSRHTLKSDVLFEAAVSQGMPLRLELRYTRLTNEFVTTSYQGATIHADAGARFESRGLIYLAIVLVGWSVVALFIPRRE